jgi:Ca2+-binding RTX toxin-like protein
MATSNYSVLKSEAEILLNSSTLPSDIVTEILDNLNQHVKVVKFDSSTSLATPTGAKVHGKDLVLIDPNGSVDLSSISKANIKGIDAFIFTTDEDVNFTLSGSNTLGFKGVVATNAGDDSIILNSENGVTVSSGAGDDSVKLGAGDDSVKLGAGDDSVDAGAGNNSVLAGAGNDSINTSAGNDTVSAGSGDDIINTGVGNDSVSTGLGNDSVNVGFGNDIVFVSSGNTVVDLGAGDDIAKLDFGFTGVAQFNGNGGSDDKLDLSLVVIDTVERSGEMLTITLDDGSVIEASNFEKFVYDNPSDNVEDIVIVGAHQLDDDF